MKKLLVLLLIMIPCLPTFALDIGFAADVNIAVDSAKDGASRASEFSMELTPAVVLMLKPKVELRPFLVIGLDKQSDPDGISATIAADRSQFWLGLGAGLYWHVFQKDIMSLSLGPKLAANFYFKPTGTSVPAYTSFTEISLGLSLPINLDFQLTKKFFLRTGITIPGIQYFAQYATLAGVETGSGTFSILDFQTGFNPFFGFYIML